MSRDQIIYSQGIKVTHSIGSFLLSSNRTTSSVKTVDRLERLGYITVTHRNFTRPKLISGISSRKEFVTYELTELGCLISEDIRHAQEEKACLRSK